VPGRDVHGCRSEALVAVVEIVTEVVVALVPFGVIEAGLKVQVEAFGNPVQAKVTAELKPFAGVTVMVEVPLLPCATVSVAGLAATLKSGGGGAVITTVAAAETDAANVLLPP
jgi:hypothetical protein